MHVHKNLKTFRTCSVPCIGFACCVSKNIHVFKSCLACDNQSRGVHSFLLFFVFFRPTPDGSRQVVYQSGKTIAFCKFTELMQRLHSFYPFLGHRLANSFCAYFGDTLAHSIVFEAILVILVWFFVLWLRPLFCHKVQSRTNSVCHGCNCGPARSICHQISSPRPGVIPGSPKSPTFTIVGAVTNRWVQPMVALLFFLFWYPPAMFSFWKPPFPISFLPPGVHSLPFAAFAVQSRAMDSLPQ